MAENVFCEKSPYCKAVALLHLTIKIKNPSMIGQTSLVYINTKSYVIVGGIGIEDDASSCCSSESGFVFGWEKSKSQPVTEKL